jgi:hypothetical protein
MKSKCSLYLAIKLLEQSCGIYLLFCCEGWILSMISNIPVAAENKTVGDNFKATTGSPAATPAMVVAVRVII